MLAFIEWELIPGLLGKLVIIALVTGVVWLILQGRSRFVITVHQGQARLKSGRATAAFLRAIEDVLRDQGIQTGSVRGVAWTGQTVLRFSRTIPEPCRQRIRNLFRLHG